MAGSFATPSGSVSSQPSQRFLEDMLAIAVVTAGRKSKIFDNYNSSHSICLSSRSCGLCLTVSNE